MEIQNVKGNTFCIDTGMTYIPFYKINDEEIINKQQLPVIATTSEVVTESGSFCLLF